MKRIFGSIWAGLVFISGAIVAMILITGAFRWCNAMLQNQIPDPMDWLGIIFIALIAGVIGGNALSDGCRLGG